MIGRVADYVKVVVSPISRALVNISMVVLFLTIMLVVADVSLRRLFNAPIEGTNDLASLAFSIIVFFPLALCALNNGHVELDLITKRLPKTAQRILEVIMVFLTTVILGVVSWRLPVQGAILQAANRSTTILEIPLYPFVYLATIGSIILTLAFFIRFLKAIR